MHCLYILYTSINLSWGRSCCNSIVSVSALLYEFCDLKNRRHIKMIIKMYTPRTFSLLSTWKINTNRPCSELKIENSHANAMVLLLTESRPNTQVSPSKGRRIMVALKSCLHAIRYMHWDEHVAEWCMHAWMRVDTLTRITVKIPFFHFVAWLTFSDYRHCAKQPRGRIHSPVYTCRVNCHTTTQSTVANTDV